MGGLYDWLEYRSSVGDGDDQQQWRSMLSAVPHIQLVVRWPAVQQRVDRDVLIHLLLHSPGHAQRLTQLWVRHLLFAHFVSERTWKKHPLWLRVREGELRVLLVIRSLQPAGSVASPQPSTRSNPSLLNPPLPYSIASHHLIEFEGVVIAVEPAKTTKSPTQPISHAQRPLR